jgi:hypothetical protein
MPEVRHAPQAGTVPEMTRDQWIERCRAGEEIPRAVIDEHHLGDQFMFMCDDKTRDAYVVFAEATGEVVDHGTWINRLTGEERKGRFSEPPEGEGWK